jgi:colanic acid/amylovoran biosynthesis glycosyltransferase
VTESSDRPVVASYCATFLKPEMLHIYRQITSLRRVRPIVIAQKREEAQRYPFDDVTIVPKPVLAHVWRRFWYRQVVDAPWQISRGEVRSLLAALNHANAQLLHIYFGHIAVHLLPLMREWDRPSVVSFHGADVTVDLDKPAYRAATRDMMESARLILVRSDSLGRALVEIGADGGKIRVQRTGIPLDEIPFRAREWPSDGAWRLVQASRLSEKKGLTTSLRAFAAFAKSYPAAIFVIAGEGPLLEQLRATAASLGIADRVSFTGFISQAELRELFYRSHIFLHPSERGTDGNQEGVPNSILEAMASGLPVFATSHGGIPEAIRHGESGVLVPERDADALARELLDAAKHPEALTRIAENGARVVAENFERNAQTRQLEDCYFEALTVDSK